MNNKLIHPVTAIFVFMFSFIIYFITMAPTVSFWDCGEFIACSYRLAVPHPPGAPLYLLVGRIFTLFPIFEDIARRVNFISVLSSALTVLFLYLISVHIIKQFMKETSGFFRFIPYVASIIGSLTFAFTNSFWHNAVESEVYAPSMLFTSLVVWLIFKWSEKSDEIGNEKYILFIAYLMGLAIGIHLLNVLTLPMIMLIIFYKKYEINLVNMVYLALVGLLVTAIVYPGVVQGIPLIADGFGFIGLLLAIILILFLFAWAVKNHHNIWALGMLSILLLTIGYSTYAMLYIRSNLDPNIDENDPETVQRFISYVKREQYGEHTLDRYQVWQQSANRNRYTSTFDFFWSYQIKYMYVRYFAWNFIGKSLNEHDVDFRRLFAVPFLLGLVGAVYHFKRDWKHALAVFVLFFMTGIAIILYLNQPDPQPRERDYSYVGSFFAFSIWISIGAAAILEWFSKRDKGATKFLIPGVMTALLFFIAPVNVLTKNYHMQDRTGNYIAWDYSYNMLIASEPNGVIFTNGDNDTFPLWYLQEVEKIRTDVRVANLSLMNTNWYIEQLKNKEPKVPISLSDADIARIMPVPWPKKRVIEMEISEQYRQQKWQEYGQWFDIQSGSIPQKISFELGPKFYNQYIRVQDYMLLNILFTNRFQKPLYFAVTVSRDNMLDELQRYLRMDGLIYKITPIPNWPMHPERLYDNLVNKFQYRNLNNPDVYYNENIIGLLQNYRAAFIELARYYKNNNNTERFNEVIKKIFETMPPEVIPYTNPSIQQYLETFAFSAGVRNLDSLNTSNYDVREIQSIGELSMALKEWEISKTAFEKILEVDSDNLRIKSYLVDTYGNLGDYDRAIAILEEWLSQNPNDQVAKQRMEEYQKKKEQENSGS